MCSECCFKYIAEHLSVCTNCGLEKRNPFILVQANYEFVNLRYPPYSRRMRFGPLTDHLERTIQRKVLDLYETILCRWKCLKLRRSRYFYNRKLMFRFLHCKVIKKKFSNVLQNLESQTAQINEMEHLLKNDPPKEERKIQKTAMEELWELFD